MSAESQSLLSGTAEIKRLLGQYDAVIDAYRVMLAAYRTGSHRGVEKALETLDGNEQKLSAARLALEEYVERIRKDSKTCAEDLSDAWEEIRRLRSTSLTPEEAGALVQWIGAILRTSHWKLITIEKRAVEKLRSISGRSTESGVPK